MRPPGKARRGSKPGVCDRRVTQPGEMQRRPNAEVFRDHCTSIQRCHSPQPMEGVTAQLAEVRVQDGESIESALRRFKRKVQQEDIIKDIKKHSFYLKPGDKRRAKQALARKRSRKKMRSRDPE